MSDKLIEQLKRHEGYRSQCYKCTAGHNTIGYGYNLDANPLHLSSLELNQAFRNGMPEHEAERLLVLMINNIVRDINNALPWWSKVPGERQDVLINMAYNMGVGSWGKSGLLEFTKTLNHVKSGSYSFAADEMLYSAWSHQVGDRAKELSEQMRTGKYA